ncbi:uncharacterized protein [Bemisia tabaci]|uniref:uncharacterized protein n=1 Tax=Bemisia tabaci TaxID=7038 RepID=UPI003B27C68D
MVQQSRPAYLSHRLFCNAAIWGSFLLLTTLAVIKCDLKHKTRLRSEFFGKGDVMRTEFGWLLAAVNETAFVYASSYNKSVFISLTTQSGIKDRVRQIAVDLEPGWSSYKRVALALRLAGKRYHYSKLFCNSKDYMNYIISGKFKSCRFDSKCPLHRDLTMLTVRQIKADDLYLETKKARLIVNEIPNQEPSQRVLRVSRPESEDDSETDSDANTICGLPVCN